MILSVPTFEDPNYTEICTFDGTDYTLSFVWNTRAETWYLSIGTGTGAPIIESIALVPNWDLLAKALTATGCPQGLLAVLVNGETDGPPGVLELGEAKRTELVYREP